MKKLLTAVVTAAVVTMSAAVPVANVSAGFVIEQDAQTAMEKTGTQFWKLWKTPKLPMILHAKIWKISFLKTVTIRQTNMPVRRMKYMNISLRKQRAQKKAR